MRYYIIILLYGIVSGSEANPLWKIVEDLDLKEPVLCFRLVNSLFEIDSVASLCKAALVKHSSRLIDLDEDLTRLNDEFQNNLENLSAQLVTAFETWFKLLDIEKEKEKVKDLSRSQSFASQDKPMPQAKRKCEAIPRLVTPDEMRLSQPLNTVRT